MAMPPDTLSQTIGVLTRREVEARMLIPLIEALGKKFDRDEVLAVVRETVIQLAQEQGESLADQLGGCGSLHFMKSLSYWTQDDALQLEVLEQSESQLDFNVKRCRYAEMYNALGAPELGAIFSCNRDFALINGFNKDADLKRSQTIMAGASHCDFRYNFPEKETN